MIKVLKKAAMVMDIVSRDKSACFSDIQKESALNKSTLSHILATLQEVGYIKRNKNGDVAIGHKFVNIFKGTSSKSLLVEIAERCGSELMSEINELAVVTMRHKEHRLTLCKLTPQKNFQVSIGSCETYSASWYTTASGRVLLAFADEEARGEIISQAGMPSASIWPEASDKESLLRELDKIKKDKFVSFSIGSLIDTMAVPTVDSSGEYSFSASCALPLISYENISKDKIIKSLKKAASHLSKELILNNIKASELEFQGI